MTSSLGANKNNLFTEVKPELDATEADCHKKPPKREMMMHTTMKCSLLEKRE